MKLWWASTVAQWWRLHRPMQEMQEVRVRSLAQKNPLEKDLATHSSIIAWKIPWTEEPGGLQSVGSQENWTWVNVCAGKHADAVRNN